MTVHSQLNGSCHGVIKNVQNCGDRGVVPVMGLAL